MGRTTCSIWASIFISTLYTTVASQSSLPSKRGLPYQGDDHASDNRLLFSMNSTINWYYTWSPWPARVINSPPTFIPLIHGLDDASDKKTVEILQNLPVSSTHLLTFNEPDGTTSSGGSSISPKDAAEAYIAHILPLRTGNRKWNISQPVVTGSSQGLDWLRRFNEACEDIDPNGCPADFVAVHWYGEFVGLVGWLDTLRDFYNSTHPDIKFWITEMALPQQNAEATLAMMNQSLAYLDKQDFVEGYAWFGAFRSSEANAWTGNAVSLFDGNGGLTDLGVLYLGGEEKGFKAGMTGTASSVSISRWALVSAGLAITIAMLQ